MPDSTDDAPEDDWQFGLDEVGPEAETAPEPLEPGSPSLENAAFVLLGVALAVLLLVAAV